MSNLKIITVKNYSGILQKLNEKRVCNRNDTKRNDRDEKSLSIKKRKKKKTIE